MTNGVTVSRGLLRQALEWIEAQPEPRMIGAAKISGALRAALEQPAPEPVAWMDAEGDLYKKLPNQYWCPPHTPLYAAPKAQQPDARTAAIQECIDRLVKGGKPAEAAMLLNHFGVDA